MARYGNVLSIYDSADQYAGSCAELFEYSRGKWLAQHEEIVQHVGTGHGILFQPLDEWMVPVVEWARGKQKGKCIGLVEHFEEIGIF